MKETEILVNRMEKAFRIANNALYFDDDLDYKAVLYQVCAALNPILSVDKIGEFYVEELEDED